MFKVKLSSNFFISLTAVVALGVAGCGGSGSGSGTGGAGGKGGGSATGGKGGNTPTGGKGGGPATGGVGGGPVGGAGGGPVATGGVGAVGGSGAVGGAGGRTGCQSETTVCTVGATQCTAGAPQTCTLDPVTMCNFWATTPNQPAVCSANQNCVAATGTCVCKDAVGCGTPPVAGDFCPVIGAATRSTCVKQADGCFTVTAGVACDAGKVCATASVATVVPVGTACGCPTVSADQTGKTTKLVGTGCATAGVRVGSLSDDAVLTCTMAGGCLTWQATTPCVMQQLTGGTDPVTGMPACVCKPPAKAGQYWVDPDPSMSTFMNGAPTGAQFPAACRFRTLTTALAQNAPAPTEVVSQHESSSNVHFLTNSGLAGVSDCTLQPNTCEAFPLKIPAGVRVYTADVGSFNPNHYVVDVDVSTAPYAVLLNHNATIEGYTFDASATTIANQGCQGASSVGNTAATCANPITSIVTTPAVGSGAATAVAPLLATLNQVQLLMRAAANGSTSAGGQAGLLVQGQGSVTAHYLSVIGGTTSASTALTAVNRGVQLAGRQGIMNAALAFTADHINIVLTGTMPQIGVDVGVAADAALTGNVPNTATIVNDATDRANSRGIRVGANGTGINVYNGMVTTTGLEIASSSTPATPLTGYAVWNSNAPAAMGVNINSGLVVGGNLVAGTISNGTSGVGVKAVGGFTTVNQSRIIGGANWFGVQSLSTTPVTATSIAADVTLTGTAAAKTVIETVTGTQGTNTTATAGIWVGSGTEYTAGAVATQPTNLAHLTINDHTTVMHYTDGMVVNNGHVISTGTDVLFTENSRDGVQILSDLNIPGPATMDSLSRVQITGASITKNGRGGVLVRDIVPVTLDAVKVIGNGVPLTAAAGFTFASFATAGNVAFGGIDVQRSQMTSGTSFLFNLLNSQVSGNTGCGVTLSGGSDNLVNRTTATGTGIRVCGFGGTGSAIDPGVTPGAVVTGQVPAATAPVGTVFGGQTNTGGKVSATLMNNTIQNNTGVGIYITEARDQDPAFAADDVTEATVQGNKVTGNLISAANAAEPGAGGIYIAQSNLTVQVGAALATTDIGCESPTQCTRVRMETFLGNTIACNGRSQLAYGVPQRVGNTIVGSAWDISSSPSLVGVTLADRCTPAVKPNTLAGYSSVVNFAGGLGIMGGATDPVTMQSVVHVSAFGVFWNSSTLASGTDYSSALAAAPQGNGDATAWGVCPGAVAVTCPIALAP